MSFKIATFNANSVRARLPILIPWLEKERPHVLCLQETKVQDVDFPVDAFARVGYQAAFRGEKAHGGVALLSTEPMEDAHFGLDDQGPSDPSRLVHTPVLSRWQRRNRTIQRV